MPVDEFRVSFRGAKNKNCAVPAFAAVVTKALYMNGVGFPVFWLIQTFWMKMLASGRSRRLLGGSY